MRTAQEKLKSLTDNAPIMQLRENIDAIEFLPTIQRLTPAFDGITYMFEGNLKAYIEKVLRILTFIAFSIFDNSDE